MKTYKDIDDFIMEVFPFEVEKLVKRKSTDEEKYIEEADTEFNEKLEAIIKGEKEVH